MSALKKFWQKSDKNFFWKRKHSPSKKESVVKISSRWLIFVVLLFGIVLLQLYSSGTSLENLRLNVGEIAGEDIVAEFEFSVPRKTEDIEQEKEKALANVYPILEFDEEVTQTQKQAIRDFFEELDRLKEDKTDYREQLKTLTDWGLDFSKTTTDVLLSDEDYQQVKSKILDVLPRMFEKGIISNKKIRDLNDYPQRPIIIRKSGEEIEKKLEDIYDEKEIKQELARISKVLFDDSQLADSFYEVASSFIIPNLNYNYQETQEKIAEAFSLIPDTETIIKKDEKIIGKHERVDELTHRTLKAYAENVESRMDETELLNMIVSRLGQIVFTALILACLIFYLRFHRRDIYDNNYKLILISIFILFIYASGFLIVNSNLSPYLIPIAFVSILLAILLDGKITVITSLIIVVLLGNFPALGFYPRVVALIVAVISSVSVHNLRHRHHFYKPMLYVSLTYILAIASVEMIKLSSWKIILQDIGFGIGNAVGSTILAIGFLPVFESLFKITTNITLLELADFQRPLLKKLTMEAPGTQSHSLVIGNLCEAAAEAIGANSLLCRVASYYHDIGKTAKPEYFIENQRGYNPHDYLSPTMSTLIIINHVKEGIEFAKKAGLPKCITDMIPQHHGTSLVMYFYNKAVEQGESVSEHDFRYPGPKPQSKEAGIMMIADSVESASRSIKEPSPQKLKAMIQKIINIKFVDGQLDECDLTLRDLHKIAEALLEPLLGMTHQRIDYPNVKTKEAKDETIYQSETDGN